jgi:hypothetical protein
MRNGSLEALQLPSELQGLSHVFLRAVQESSAKQKEKNPDDRVTCPERDSQKSVQQMNQHQNHQEKTERCESGPDPYPDRHGLGFGNLLPDLVLSKINVR